jgi:hypothetical protein
VQKQDRRLRNRTALEGNYGRHLEVAQLTKYIHIGQSLRNLLSDEYTLMERGAGILTSIFVLREE